MAFVISLIILIIVLDIVVDYFVITGIGYLLMRRGALRLQGVSSSNGYRHFLGDFNRMIVRRTGW